MNRVIRNILLFVLSLSLASCVMETGEDGVLGHGSGKLVDVYLNLMINNMEDNSDPDSKASLPSGDKEPETAAERTVDSLWVLQYDLSGALLTGPVKHVVKDQQELNNLPVQLVEGVPSVVYVITNIRELDWLDNQDVTTEDKFLKLNLPSPDPIKVGNDDGDVKAEDVRIPMQGKSGEVTVNPTTVVEVPVTRMYAKVKLTVSLKEELYEKMSLYNIEMNNIPWTCRVGTRSCKNGNEFQVEEEKPGDYETDVDWITRTFKPSDNRDYEYVIYIPENIQGETKVNLAPGEKFNLNDKYKLAPDNAFTVTVRFKHKSDDGVTQEYAYKICPGGNNLNNFNIKRNNVYRVTVTLNSDKYEEHIPSSNCFVLEPGQTFSFEPYYRLEKGGDYEFVDYLDASKPDGDKRRIESVAIIWQTKDCIGDNSNGDLVYLKKEPSMAGPTHDWKIYIKTLKKGNALIGAYNHDNEIVWSWHIWCTDHHPDNVANAVSYKTYQWDENGIYPERERVPGYALMSCNLGALRDGPNEADVANGLINPLDETTNYAALNKSFDNKDTYFGMLYQWGRKDPFPPGVKVNLREEDYTTATTGYHYRNDNTTVATKTARYDRSQLFHSETNSSLGNIDYVRYAIANPTVFICGTLDTYDGNPNGNSNVIYCNNNKITSNGTVTDENSHYFNNGDWLLERQDRLWGAAKYATKSLAIEDPRYNYKYDGGGKIPEEEKPHLHDDYGEKSIFDPCPTGWRVPPGEMWIGITQTGHNPLDIGNINACKDIRRKPENYTNLGELPDKGFGYGFGISLYMEAWKEGATSYFPTQGSRTPNGTLIRVSWKGCGNYYSANPDGNRVNTVHVHDNTFVDLWSPNGNPPGEEGVDWSEKWYTNSAGNWVRHNQHYWTFTHYTQPFETLNYMYHCKSAACSVRCVRDTK